MGKVWLIMLISSVSVLLFKSPALAMDAMLKGANSAVKLSMELVAMYGFWLGFLMLIEKSGISKVIARLLNPLIKFLFKGASDEARGLISMNMSANLIGLGNAATPMGIKAINALEKDGLDDGKANTNMIMLIVISSTSLQLLPTTVISMRSAHGSANAADFLLPCIIATVCSTVIGIALVKLCAKLFSRKAVKKGVLCRNT